jgi:hypothetical protein
VAGGPWLLPLRSRGTAAPASIIAARASRCLDRAARHGRLDGCLERNTKVLLAGRALAHQGVARLESLAANDGWLDGPSGRGGSVRGHGAVGWKGLLKFVVGLKSRVVITGPPLNSTYRQV